jgi:hypothetical protein
MMRLNPTSSKFKQNQTNPKRNLLIKHRKRRMLRNRLKSLSIRIKRRMTRSKMMLRLLRIKIL